MTSPPPPLADPHSTAIPVPEIGQRTLGSSLKGLVQMVLGALFMAGGLFFAGFVLREGIRYGVHYSDVPAFLFAMLLNIVLLPLDGLLIVQGLRILKHGR